MSSSKLASRFFIAAVALAIVAIPSLALAQPAGGQSDVYEPARKGDGGPHAKGKRRFPMKGERFLTLVSERIQKVTARVDARLKKRKVPPKLQAEIKADLAKASQTLKQAAEKVAADGKVTRQEAREVRKVAKKMKRQARKKYGKLRRGGRKGRGAGKRAGGQPGNRSPARF